MWLDLRVDCVESTRAHLSVYAGFINTETIDRARKASFMLGTTRREGGSKEGSTERVCVWGGWL